ncbi:unnamed protein product [Auanema sp. JU1783]|nr:unnamed protein product [Auanema sp. JU1783]
MVPEIVQRVLNPIIIITTRSYFFFVCLIFNLYNWFKPRESVAKPTDDLLLISATQAVGMIAERKIQSADLVEAYIRRIEQVNPMINAVCLSNFEEARDAARDLDTRIADMDDDELHEYVQNHPLAGVPFTMKDAMEVDGKIITCGVYNRKNTRCNRTAEVVKRVQNAGGILLAITNVPEVCMWVESNNTVYGRTSNPYDTRRMAGGSSGGEGSLIGSAGSLIGVGSDIGGSIRMPSFFNGIFGFKSTPGVVPLDGHIPPPSGYRTKMLRVGPMCRYAEDISLFFKVMGGDAVLPLKLDEPVSMRKIKVYYMEGIQENAFVQPLSRDMKKTLRKAVQYLETKHDLIAHRLSLPLARHAIEFFLTSMENKGGPTMKQYMLSTEADQGSVNCLMEIPKLLFGKSTHTVAGIMSGILDGADTMSEEMKKEFFYKRDRLIRELTELLGNDGILLFPSWPCTALFHNQPLLSPFNFAYTALFNSLALPVVQCPMGLDKNGLPLGVQVVAAPQMDRLLIAAAKDLEEGFGGWVPPGTRHF